MSHFSDAELVDAQDEARRLAEELEAERHAEDVLVRSMALAWLRFSNLHTLFPLGTVVVTSGVLALMESGKEVPVFELLGRHASGDDGDMHPDDKRENRRALVHGGRIFSSYKVPALGESEYVWVITEADRSATTVLLPSEY